MGSLELILGSFGLLLFMIIFISCIIILIIRLCEIHMRIVRGNSQIIRRETIENEIIRREIIENEMNSIAQQLELIHIYKERIKKAIEDKEQSKKAIEDKENISVIINPGNEKPMLGILISN